MPEAPWISFQNIFRRFSNGGSGFFPMEISQLLLQVTQGTFSFNINKKYIEGSSKEFKPNYYTTITVRDGTFKAKKFRDHVHLSEAFYH